MPIHPKCGKTFPGGERAGHCATCCETFIGNAAFEAHRIGNYADGRECEIQPYDARRDESGNIRYGHWQDTKGHWHYGRQLSAAESAEVFASRNAEAAK